MEVIYKEESYKIMGAVFEVYKVLGPGFLEAVYQESLEIEFNLRGISFDNKCKLKLDYKGHTLSLEYKPDFVCDKKIILEIKAVSTLDRSHRAQLHNYLKATGYQLGILINFGHYPLIEFERIANAPIDSE